MPWLNRLRKLLIRWEKKAENYLGLVQLGLLNHGLSEDDFRIG